MEVEIKGSGSVNCFEVVVHFEQAASRTFNITKELGIDENLDLEITQCAPNEHFWFQAAIEARSNLEEFEKIQYDKYQAWVQKYARYYLKGLGEKGTSLTKGLIEQTASLIFSKEGMDRDTDKYAPIAHKGYEEECRRVGVMAVPYAEFLYDMYINTSSYEEWELMHISLNRKAEQLEAIAKAFNVKSWSVKVKAADKRALIGANL